MTLIRVADNWSMQDVSALLATGLEDTSSKEIIFTNGLHSYNPILTSIIQIEALFDLLTDIILCDEIHVDEKFTSSWEAFDSPILEAKRRGIIKAYPFLQDPEKINSPRDQIIEHLCSTQSLKEAHQRNVENWDLNKEVSDSLLSATLWGGAGMCARSFIWEKAYTPHPLRKRLFVNSGFLSPAEDSVHQIKTFINDQKVKVTKKLYGNDLLFSSCVTIPAIPLKIIQEANSVDQVISCALQMRDDFRTLRDWLKTFQDAISADDSKRILKCRKTLNSVSEYIDKRMGYVSANNPMSMEAGIGIFKIAGQGNPIESIKNQFGIRATLNKLIFSGSGRAELRKLVKMFGENGTQIGYQIEHHFLKTV